MNASNPSPHPKYKTDHLCLIIIIIIIITITIITIIIIIILTAYTAAFPQSGSSSAGIRVISESDIRTGHQHWGDSPTLFEL